jgi:hypothetical protein
VDAAEGLFKGVGFVGNNLYLVIAAAGSIVVLYILSGMVKMDAGTIDIGSKMPQILGGVMGLSGGALLYFDGEHVDSVANPDLPHTIAHDVVETGKQAFSNDVKNMTAATTASGWSQFGYNFTHPGDYFPAYAQEVRTRWKNINDVGSFFSAWTYTLSFLGDMFSTNSQTTTPSNPASDQPLTSNSYDDWLATHPIADDSQRETARIFFGQNI